jgi:hypothetical protein
MSLSTADRLEIHELIALHGHLVDDHRDDLDQLFTDDAIYDLEDYGMGIVRGLPALRELFALRPGEQPLGHHVTNVIIVASSDAVRVRSKGLAVMASGKAGTLIYDDVVVKTPAGWRISARKVIRRREP